MSVGLFELFQLGDVTIANRLVIAPMTQSRADLHGVVPPMMATYYQQLASAGLIISEIITISPEAVGYPFAPGIYSDAQAESWRRLTDAVRSAGGHVFVQLQHRGRTSHPSLLPDNATPVAPSALRPTGQCLS